MREQITRKINFFKTTVHKDYNLIRNFGLWYGATDFAINILLRGPLSKLGIRLKKCYYDKVQQKYEHQESFQILTDRYRDIDPDSSEAAGIGRDAPIWVFWWQGFERAAVPDIVKVCLASVKEHAGPHPIKIITKENYQKYAMIPDYIMAKFRGGGGYPLPIFPIF